jgi:CDP-glycerol glycerophosphotransferase (TagB/SpsB family)
MKTLNNLQDLICIADIIIGGTSSTIVDALINPIYRPLIIFNPGGKDNQDFVKSGATIGVFGYGQLAKAIHEAPLAQDELRDARFDWLMGNNKPHKPIIFR